MRACIGKLKQTNQADHNRTYDRTCNRTCDRTCDRTYNRTYDRTYNRITSQPYQLILPSPTLPNLLIYQSYSLRPPY